jgi:hypothetical protein
MSKGDWLVLARSGYQLFKAEAYCKRMGWFYERVTKNLELIDLQCNKSLA